MNKYVSEAKAFALRGHVVELTVAVVIGFAIQSIVFAFIDDIFAPIISMIFGEFSLSSMDFDINDSVFFYGDFIEAIIVFAAIVAAVVLFVIGPYNKLMAQVRTDPAAAPDTRVCPDCLSAIPAAAKRCRYCTAESAPVSQG
jgi:large conductance mechanosensitive channel